MKKVLYAAILIALLFAPVNRVEAGKLLPVRAVAVYTSDGQIVLETDAEYKGQGQNLEEAMNQLIINTPAIVYLDTAEYLLVSKDAEKWIPQLERYFKPSVKVCVCDAEGNVADAAEYVDVHREITKLRRWRTK